MPIILIFWSFEPRMSVKYVLCEMCTKTNAC